MMRPSVIGSGANLKSQLKARLVERMWLEWPKKKSGVKGRRAILAAVLSPPTQGLKSA
jgi:hypothetical protein